MAHQILVIEYEPRYIQRIEEAAASGGFATSVARTGDEAIQALPKGAYDLIVLSTIIPRYSTAQLIRSIRNDATNASTPILLTTSGYSGSDPRSDAVKLGATDMLIKPYAPPDFIQKVKTVLNLPAGDPAAGDESTAETVRLSTRQIFGDLLDDSQPTPRTVEQSLPSEPAETVKVPKVSPPDQAPAKPEVPAERRKRTAADDVDQMLADTLAGVRLPAARKKRKTTSAEDLDKLLENTLSGLEPTRSRESKLDQPVPEDVSEVDRSIPVVVPPPPVEPPPEEIEEASAEAEDEPFPEVTEEPGQAAEPDEPPFEGVGERSDEPAAVGTTLIRDEAPPAAQLDARAEPEVLEDSGHFGQYVLLEKIATGGMAEVWKARMRGLEGFEKIVAIKKILPHLSDNEEFIDMFVDEAKLAAQLSHNNIVHIYDLGKIDGSWFIAMEYNDGYDLKSLITRGKEVGRPLPVPLGLFIASKVASALDYAHRKRGFDDQELGVVHRDVSPQNVLLSREGDIKICDFGIAKAASKASHTQAGALKGKLQYMSPEQAWGRHVDHRSDIFATAAVLFEMLAGRKLFSGESELSVLDQVREARVPSPSTYNPEVSTEIDETVLKGLEKDPAARFRTAGEMARAIDAILGNYKPAPSNSDLALYVAAIEDPQNHPMPAMPASRAPQVKAPAEEKPAVYPVSPVVMIPSPAPVPDPSPEIASAAVGPAIGDETIPVGAFEQNQPEEPAAVFGAAGTERPRKSRAIPIATILIVLAAVAGGAVMLLRPDAEPGAESDASTAAGTSTAAPVGADRAPMDATVPIPGEGLSPEALTAEQLVDAGDPGELGEADLAMIEQAVKDRIEAERQRLESQRQAAVPPARTQPEQRETRSEPPASSPAPQQQPAAPPAAETARPSTSTAPASTETAAETAAPPAAQPTTPTPAPAEPARPAVRRGQLVEPGTPGLVEPKIVSLKKVAYPPLARRNRVEGLVIVRALISEDGRVLETELLRGVSQNVGLNEAALEMVRGGTFTAPQLENVAVRVWKTIPIPFKMQ